jgi:hypothetical protein
MGIRRQDRLLQTISARILHSWQLVLVALVAAGVMAAGCGSGTYDEQAAGETTEESSYYSNDGAECETSYVEVCIPADAYDLDCTDIAESDFEVVGGDPHGFDGDQDGVGCESSGEYDVESPEYEYESVPDDGCEPSYPDACIPVDSYDLDCADVGEFDFTVVGEDPNGFDADGDGIGCESDESFDYSDDYADDFSDEYGDDLDCSDVSGPIIVPPDDPNGLDADGDGVGCED